MTDSEYTPTTEQVRATYADGEAEGTLEDYAEFDRWLAAHDAEVRAESAKAHERTKRGAKTLGEIVERQIEDMLRWAGMEDQIGTDDPDQQLAWERCAEMPGKIAALEAELAEVRAGVVAEEPEWEYGVEMPLHTGTVVVASRDEATARAEAWLYPLHRRRKAGPWVPVKQEGADG